MKKLVQKTVLFLFLLITVILSGCGSANQGKTARVGVRDSVPGFGYKNPISETYSGMEVELARMLALAIGYSDVEFVGVTADTREQVLQDGSVDFVIATYSITEERQQEFDFSEPYYTNYIRVMVENSSLFQTLADLEGKCVGVTSGSTSALYLAEEMTRLKLIPEFDTNTFNPETFKGGISFKCLDTYPDLVTALEQGEIDAACSDGSILAGYLNDERSLLPEAFSKQELGVCTPKNSPLSAKIRTQIDQWRSDGQLDSLIAKWDLDE